MSSKDCLKHTGMERDISTLMYWKKNMTDPEGTLEHLWSGLNKKISLTLSISLMGAILTIVGITFTLNYRTQQTIVSKLGDLKSDVAVINKQLEHK